jgi:hypothetical protein
MSTTQLIIYCLAVCINSAVLFLVYGIIARWMKRNEKKIDDLEQSILKIEEYIRYSTHVIDSVYIETQNRLIDELAKQEKYEQAECVRKNRELTIHHVLIDMRTRIQEEMGKMQENIGKWNGQKKEDRKED